MSIENPNTDPSLFQDQALQAASHDMLIDGMHMSMFEIPLSNDPNKYIENDRLLTDNTECFARLVTGGVDALKDGETIAFATAHSITLDDPWSTTVRKVSRHGNSFTIIQAKALESQPLDRSAKDQVPALEISDDQARKFCKGLETNRQYLPGFMGDLIERGDKLGQFIQALGYTKDGSSYPVPLALQENVSRARYEGVNISPVKIMDTGNISGDDYVDAWAEGEFPMSNRVEWFSHDGAQDHFSGLLVFGNETMPIAQMFAQAVKSSESIVGREYPDEYEINKNEKAQKIDVIYRGQEKIDHAAFCLDQFTAQLHSMTHYLDTQPYGEDFEPMPKHMDFIDEVVSVILSNPEYAPKLIGYLESIGSKSMASGSFDRELFARELLDGAQKFWGITPKEPKPSQEFSDVNSDY